MQVSQEDFDRRVRGLLHPGLPSPEQRYEQFATLDPYPDIPPALLHSGHIASYAMMVGMIDPFDFSALHKPATYLVPLEGPVRYRDEKGAVQTFYLSNNIVRRDTEFDVRPEFVLKPNSLCYVTLQPIFQMPAYIAGRFNLIIRDIYRGFLVGTGPLVDPGFKGRISIPLHNFTNKEYQLRAGEGFVYFEFTKLSWKNGRDHPPLPAWLRSAIEVQPPFPESKNRRKTIDDYLDQATGSGPAQSALGEEIQRMTNTLNRMQGLLRIFTVAGVAGVAGLVFTCWQVYIGAQQFTQAAATDTNGAIAKIVEENRALRSELQKTKELMTVLQARLPAPKGGD